MGIVEKGESVCFLIYSKDLIFILIFRVYELKNWRLRLCLKLVYIIIMIVFFKGFIIDCLY